MQRLQFSELFNNALTLGLEYKSVGAKSAFEYQPQLETSIRDYRQNIAEFSINELANYKKLWIKS